MPRGMAIFKCLAEAPPPEFGFKVGTAVSTRSGAMSGAGSEKASLRNLVADFGFCLGRLCGLQAAMGGKAGEGFS